MKFDYIIMNPPYDGLKNLYGKMTLIAKQHAKDVVCLSPYRNYIFLTFKKAHHVISAQLEKYFNSYEIVDPSFFPDLQLTSDLAILFFKENNPNKNIYFDDLFWQRFKNVQLTKSIAEKFLNYPIKIQEKIIRKSLFDKYLFKVAYTRIRGNHRRHGKPDWDYTTLLDREKMTRFDISSTDERLLFGFPFDTEDECKNFVNYVNSDIFGFGMLIYKLSQNNDSTIFNHVPYLSTYTKQWSDEEIAEEIGLTTEELNYIYEEMKPYGWKTRKNK